MQIFQRMMVALDLSSLDAVLINYAAELARQNQTEKVYFVHIAKRLELPKNLVKRYREESNFVPVDEQIKQEIERRVKENVVFRMIDFEVNVLEGSPLNQLMHWEDVKNITVTVVGRKLFSKGSGVTARKLARRSKSAVLFVTELHDKQIEKIVVPIDFSTQSKDSLQVAIDLSKNTPGTPAITTLNIYDVPDHVHYQASRTDEQFAEIVREDMQEALEYFMKDVDTKGLRLTQDLVKRSGNSVAKQIYQYAHENSFNLIVLGAKGRSNLELMLIGSVAEKLLIVNENIPCLVTKG